MNLANLAKCTSPTLALVLALGVAIPGDARAQGADSPESLLQLWQQALAQRDYDAYLACLHTGARQVPEYGSREAMEFWAQEMGELSGKGFVGGFRIEPVNEAGERFPPGSLRAHPITDGRPVHEAILLVREAGHWTILRIFS